tara:strand:+ start:1542 stop:3329 length:1788 start_codon:yes stop_codon:yes gene_type:complete
MADNKSWDYAHKLTAKAEAGVSVDKTDKGNQNTIAGVTMYSKTYYGLTLAAYADMKGLTYPPASKKDFKKLNKDFVKAFGGTTSAPVSSADGKNKVKALFKEAYWDKHKLGDITDERVAASIYDALVNQGLTFGNKGQANSSMLNTLKRLGIDTSAGFKDLDDAIAQVNSAIKDKGGDVVLNSYAQTRENSYIKSSSKGGNKKFSRGWVNRLNDHRTDTSKVDWQKLPKDTVLTSDSISKARINTNYDVITATVPGDGTELTQADKDQIAIDIQPTPAPLPEDAPNVISQIEIDKDNARRKQEEENKKKEGVYQPKELIPLSDLSSEEIDALTDEERKQYGLQPKITEEDKAAQIEKERLEAEELEKEKELHSKEQQLKKEAEEKKKREQRKARDKVVDKDGDGIPDTIDADAGEPAPEGQETVSTEEQGVIEEQEKESAIETVETEEIEVLDANGNIKKITVPTVTTPTTPATVETESTTEQVIEEKPELVKPKFKDFKTSSDYVRARMKYFKSIEDEGGENTVDFDNELDDDEIKESVDMEQNSTVIDSSKRNIFKTNGKTNIFNSILGAVDDIGKGIQQELNNITKSINNKQ